MKLALPPTLPVLKHLRCCTRTTFLGLSIFLLLPFIGSSQTTVTQTNSTSIPIPDNNTTGISSPVTIAGIPSGAIASDIRLSNVAINHTWVGDLTIELIAPDGEKLTVLDRSGTSTNFGGDSSNSDAAFPYGFNDAAAVSAEAMGATILGTLAVCRDDGICAYSPAPEPANAPPNDFAGLAALIATNASSLNGTWTLHVSDGAGGDAGSLESWTLELDWIIPTTADITLCVDLSCFPSVTAPSVLGAFNGWCANCNFITDPDGDGTYCATVTLSPGNQEYKFFFQEQGQEDMTPGDPCTVTNFGFTNRVVTVVAGVPQMLTYGWEVCDPTCPPPPATTDITLCVDLSCFPAVTAPAITGAFNGWCAGCDFMFDPDGDGTYCGTVALLPGDQEYKFFFQQEGEEVLTPGDPCTLTSGPFTNRVVTVVDGVTQMLTYGWEVCDPACVPLPTTADITLCVDLTCFTSVTAPSIFGAFNGWNAGANPIADPDGDGIYCATIAFLPGNQEYKFFFQEQGEEGLTPGDPCTVTNFGFTNRVVTVVAGAPQMLTYGWEVCGTTCVVTTADITLCVDLSCYPSVTAPSIFGAFNGWCANCTPITDPDGDDVYCATVSMDAGNQEYKFFFQEEGEEGLTPGDPCTVTNFGFTNRVVTVVAGVAQMLTYGWEVCGSMCIPPLPGPDLPITFEEDPTTINFNLFDFAGAVSTIAVDPTDPNNMVVCTNKTAGAATFAGTVVGNNGLENPIPFAAGETKISVRVWSPTAGTPVLLKVENSVNAGISSETLATTTVAMMWETLVFDFSMGNPQVNPANTYDKVVIFFNFGNIGTNQIYYFDDIMFCPPPIVSLTCPTIPTVEGCSAAAAPPYADLAAFLAAGGTAVDADPASFMLLSSVENGTCPLTIVRTYQVSDFCDNTTSCTQTITVDDTTPPTIQCPADLTLACAGDIVVDPANATGRDNCSALVTATGPVLISGQADCSGAQYEVTYTATDPCGNMPAVCVQTITIQNNGPLLTCPADVTVACSDDIVVMESDVAVITSCALGYTVLITGPNVLEGLPNCTGSRYRYYYTVTDDCGRVAVCFREFVIDNAPPTIVCSPAQTVECASDIIIDDSEVTVTTSCDLKPSITSTTTINGTPDCPGTTYTITYTVTDPCGRSASCPKVWTIQNDAPVIQECAPDRIVECSDDIKAEPELLVFTVSCELGYTLTPGPVVALNNLGDCPGAQYSITYTLEDACGRSTDCTQIFTIDNRAPRVYPDEDQYVLCREDIAPRWEDCFVETDCNLGIVKYEIIGPIEEDTPDCNGKIINYLYSVTDACGRMTCVGQAWIIKNHGLQFDGNIADITVSCSDVPDGSDVVAAYGGCGGVSVTIEDVQSPLAGLDYVIRRTYTASDDCGNSISETQQITVLCNGPSSSREICTQNENFWGSPKKVNEDGIRAKDLLNSLNLANYPLIIGVPGAKSLSIYRTDCVLRLLPSRGSSIAFPEGMDNVVLNDMSLTCDPAPVGIDEYGRILNRLAGQVLTLALNDRVDSNLGSTLLSDLCLVFPEEILTALPENATVADLLGLGNKGLADLYRGNLNTLRRCILDVNNYFVGCRTTGCDTAWSNPQQKDNFQTDDNTWDDEAMLEIMPNPAINEVTLTYQLPEVGEALLQVFNATGQQMHLEKVIGLEDLQTQSLDISQWPQGIYLVTITLGELVLTKKLVKY